jgi:hypothetical protein
VVTNRFAAREYAAIAEINENGGYFQLGISLAVESARFYIDDDGEETAKAACHCRIFFHLLICL